MFSPCPSGELPYASAYQNPTVASWDSFACCSCWYSQDSVVCPSGNKTSDDIAPRLQTDLSCGSSHPGRSRTKAEESGILGYLLRLRPCVLVLLPLPRLVSGGRLFAKAPPTLFTPVSSRSSRLATANVWCLAQNAYEPFKRSLFPQSTWR